MCTESRRENKKAERNPGRGHWQTRSMKTHMSFYGHVNFPLLPEAAHRHSAPTYSQVRYDSYFHLRTCVHSDLGYRLRQQILEKSFVICMFL